MHSHLKEFLIMIAFCVPIGLAIGLVYRRLNPEGVRRCALWSARLGWKFWALLLCMFVGLAVMSAIEGNFVRATFFSLFAVLYVRLLRKSTAKDYPDEDELTRIREFDYKQLWPLWPPKSTRREKE